MLEKLKGKYKIIEMNVTRVNTIYRGAIGLQAARCCITSL
jgi:hypothetical protein